MQGTGFINMAGRCSIFSHRSATQDRDPTSLNSLAAPAALESYTVVEPLSKNREGGGMPDGFTPSRKLGGSLERFRNLGQIRASPFKENKNNGNL